MKPGRSPNPIVRAMMQAVQHHQQGRLDEAERGYRQVLQKDARNPDALHLLGLIEHQRGRCAEAIPLIERAIQIKPGEATFFVNLGQVYKGVNKLDDAERCERRAIQLQPKIAEAHAYLAGVLRAKGQLDEAEASVRQALALNPNLGAAHMNLGNIVRDRGDSAMALQCFERSLRLGAPRHEVLTNLGDLLRVMGRWDEARAALEEAIRLSPGEAAARWNVSLLYLLTGDLKRGFAEYEWRLKQPGAEGNRFKQPLWDGSDLNGRTILLHAEQGYGDAIQFVRYAPMVAARGGRVVLECQAALVKLLSAVEGVSECIARGAAASAAFDVQAPLLSLPHIFGTTLETIPARVPYIKVDDELQTEWRALVAAPPGVRKIGLVWAGNPAHSNDRNRSIPFSELAALSAVPSVKWFSLQIGPAAEQARQGGLELVDLTQKVNDFSDSAALVSALDLVITVDTSAAHLAGALARPVWVLQPAFPDWRWLLGRSDSVWYPTMRLFRQKEAGRWGEVIADVINALSDPLSLAGRGPG
ncbi:MAG TPA: tetratricopeptide repeat protein [Tepidisphaeraceae bacterium]